MATEDLTQLQKRVSNLEQHHFEQYATLLEIMSHATFFGGQKRTSCRHAKQGQCGFFTLSEDAKEKLPLAMECRIQDCTNGAYHYHIEVSNLTCTLCPNWHKNAIGKKPKNGLVNQLGTSSKITF